MELNQSELLLHHKRKIEGFAFKMILFDFVLLESSLPHDFSRLQFPCLFLACCNVCSSDPPFPYAQNRFQASPLFDERLRGALRGPVFRSYRWTKFDLGWS